MYAENLLLHNLTKLQNDSVQDSNYLDFGKDGRTLLYISHLLTIYTLLFIFSLLTYIV